MFVEIIFLLSLKTKHANTIILRFMILFFRPIANWIVYLVDTIFIFDKLMKRMDLQLASLTFFLIYLGVFFSMMNNLGYDNLILLLWFIFSIIIFVFLLAKLIYYNNGFDKFMKHLLDWFKEI